MLVRVRRVRAVLCVCRGEELWSRPTDLSAACLCDAPARVGACSRPISLRFPRARPLSFSRHTHTHTTPLNTSPVRALLD